MGRAELYEACIVDIWRNVAREERERFSLGPFRIDEILTPDTPYRGGIPAFCCATRGGLTHDPLDGGQATMLRARVAAAQRQPGPLDRCSAPAPGPEGQEGLQPNHSYAEQKFSLRPDCMQSGSREKEDLAWQNKLWKTLPPDRNTVSRSSTSNNVEVDARVFSQAIGALSPCRPSSSRC